MRRKWTNEEESLIREKYPYTGIKGLPEILGVTPKQASDKAFCMGLRKMIPKDGFKICRSCAIQKPLSDFYKDTFCKSGVKPSCKKCNYQKRKIKYNLNLEESRAKTRESSKKFRASETYKKWRSKNREKINERFKKYNKKKYRTDIQYNLRVRLSALVRAALKGRVRKSEKTENLLGCSFGFFKDYFISKLTKNMTWNDVLSGKIHIDHIIPVSSFDLSNPEQQRKCFHYTNLQPLWETTELSTEKGDDHLIGNFNKNSKIIDPTTDKVTRRKP